MEDFISQNEFQSEMSAIEEANFNSKCDEILSRADKFGIQLEVVYSAFKHKEQFPSASLLECLQVGAYEWDVLS
jgi:peptide subunit release factor 1 (eRF1)